MAIYHLTTKPVARASGRSAVAAAAYRSGERLADERTGTVHDYTARRGVERTGLVGPGGSHLGVTREVLWNLAESSEKRKNARTGREWEIAIPEELMRGSRRAGRELVAEFAQVLADRYGVAVDYAIHSPNKRGDQRAWHAHLLATTRRVELRDGHLVLGAKADVELGDKDRKAKGLGRGAAEVTEIRALWADLANRALERAGREERIDHRSYRDQGRDQVPTVRLGHIASAMERRGERSDRGDLNRAIRARNQVLEEAARAARIPTPPATSPAQVEALQQRWTEAVAAELHQVRAQAARLEPKAKRQHAAVLRRSEKHDQAEPRPRLGIKTSGWEKAHALWVRARDALVRRAQQLVGRISFLGSIARDDVSGRARRLAERRAEWNNPVLVADLRAVREERAAEATRRFREKQKRDRQEEKDKGRER